MTAEPLDPAPVRRAGVLRERLLAAASGITGRDGWTAVTMARLADEAGVSRQTVYNEVGGKPALAEAMVLRELGLFLTGAEQAFTDHPDDPVGAVRQASRSVLETGLSNPLLRAVVSSSHGAEHDLLPLLTTHSEALLETAAAVVRDGLARYDLDLTAAQREVGIDMVVRLVLSHVMQPTGSPAETADGIAWVAGRVLRG